MKVITFVFNDVAMASGRKSKSLAFGILGVCC